MFAMTSDISIGQRQGVKPNAVKWKVSVSSFTDTCSITLPLASYTASTKQGTFNPAARAERSIPFKKGDKVSVAVGYNGRNSKVFEGFVSKIDYGDNLQIGCEGYGYLLKDCYFNKSYKSTTVRGLLQDLVSGTEIRLSPSIDDIPLTNVWFKNARATKVLEWLQKECCCKVFFDGPWLYAGASKYVFADPTLATADKQVRLRAGYNIIDADELQRTEAEEVRMEITEKDSEGKIKRTKSETARYSSVKQVKVRPGLPSGFLAKALRELQQDENHSGFEGNITLFLVPRIHKGAKIEIEDLKYPERSGSYFAEAVEGFFSASGGRQTTNLKWYGNG